MPVFRGFRALREPVARLFPMSPGDKTHPVDAKPDTVWNGFRWTVESVIEAVGGHCAWDQQQRG